jgi:hypothetical protein
MANPYDAVILGEPQRSLFKPVSIQNVPNYDLDMN